MRYIGRCKHVSRQLHEPVQTSGLLVVTSSKGHSNSHCITLNCVVKYLITEAY